MINEKKFIHNYNSFWEKVTPMTRSYVTNVNKHFLKSFNGQVVSRNDGDRGLINETAFNMCKNFYQDIHIAEDLNYKTSLEIAHKKITILEGREVDLKIEREEVLEIFSSLKLYLNNQGPLFFNPRFKGCGFLYDCHCDILTQSCIIEVKSGDRNVIGSDIRQLLTYSALSYIETGLVVEFVCYLNPRRGIYFQTNLEELCFSVSSNSARDLFYEINKFLNGSEISK